MRLLFMVAIVLAVGFYVYTNEYLPSTVPPPVEEPVGVGPVTMMEIDALAQSIGLKGLNELAKREPVTLEANAALQVRAENLLERPGSNLKKAWLRNFISMQETLQRSPTTNVRADVGQLYRDWQAMHRLEKTQQ